MDNLDDSENNVKVFDSAYSNSCSNSQSRRSRSSKSTHSGSHSSGSSGYGGKPSTSGSSATLNQLPEKRTNEKEGKKNKKQQLQTELVQIQAEVEFRLPDPAPVTVEKAEPRNAAPPSPANTQLQLAAQRSLETSDKNTDENPAPCSALQPSMPIVTNKSLSPEGFSCVISMHDGVVLYMSSLTATLGFPKDMWIGRSFIDFVHPLDHSTFASQITKGLAVPKKITGAQDAVQAPDNSVSTSTIFCRIRRYRGLMEGYNAKENMISFMPFMLKLSFRNVGDEKGLVMFLVVQATPLFSAFKVANEIVVNAIPFVMRHVANGNLEYIDNEAVPFLGYLPQDINGQDVLKLYHPEDLAYIRHVYETVVKQGRTTPSKPYRLMAQNGHYIKLETEWSSFINPWSRKLDFVVGKHHVVEGPANPDVFQAPPPKPMISEMDAYIEELKESIVRILNEVPTSPAEVAKQQKRCQDLASFMESLIEDQPKLEEELRIEIHENDNIYERDSVMLGGISPHHDNDSKSSTSTPLSYNQLNFNINLKRYFDSHEEPFDKDKLNNTEKNIVALNGQHDFNVGSMSPMGQNSVEMALEESACVVSDEKALSLPHDYQPKRLTESLLNKHNSDMEKMFVKKHRESRPLNKEDREKISNENKQKKKDHLIRCNTSFVPTVNNSSTVESQVYIRQHGQKRALKQLEADTSPNKQLCTSPRQLRRRQPYASAPAQPADATATATATVSAPTSAWPPNFMNGMNPFMAQQMSLMSPITAVPGFLPMYYLPTAGPVMPAMPAIPAMPVMPAMPAMSAMPAMPAMSAMPAMPCTSELNAPNTTEAPVQPLQVPAVYTNIQYMTYGHHVFGAPIMVPSPFQYANVQNNLRLTTSSYEEACKPGLPLRQPSKSTQAAWREEKRAAAVAASMSPPSLKLGQGRSASISSATKALNRSTEAVPDSLVSRDCNVKSEGTMDRTDGSSYSSFYSSFFKTDSGSADDSDAKNNQMADTSPAHPLRSQDNLRNKPLQKRKMEPPWMEHVCVTSELIYKYQVMTKSLDEILISDKKKLEEVEQPSLVNEQLSQLYLDLQLEGVAARLTLEEGTTSSGSSGEETSKRLAMDSLAKRAKRKRKYGKLVMIYEEDAPLPSPDEDAEPEPSTSAVP